MKLEDALLMKEIKNEQNRVVLNVVYTGTWLTSRFQQFLKPFGLSEQQFNVLRILRGQKGKSINLQDIQVRMVHHMSNATRLVEKLRIKGLVERNLNTENRRMVDINITNDGLKLLSDIDKEFKKQDQKSSAKLTEKEAKQLNSLLRKLRE
jgi:DNA-binding MarR family transcriptional regulator